MERKQEVSPDLSVPDQVLDVGRWRRLLYDFERQDNKGLQVTEQKGMGRSELFPSYVRERFAKYYSPSIGKLDAPATGSDQLQKLHEIQDALPEEQALYSHTAGDEVKAGMAAAAVCRSVAAKMAPKKSNQDMNKLRSNVEGLELMQEKGVDVGDRLKKAKAKLAKAEAEAQDMAAGVDPVAIRQGIRKGVEQAQKELEEYDDVMKGLSWGTEPGQPARMSTEDARALVKRLNQGDAKFRRIALLGRKLRAEAAEKQKQKSDLERTEVTDVEQGKDVARMLPREILDMTSPDPNMRMLWAIRYAQDKCLQYKLSGKTSKQKGPIVFCADESGSQSGEPEIQTKATAMAFLEIARRQRRGWAYIHFDADVTRVDSFPKDGQVSPQALLDCMEWFTCGGTNFAKPLDKAVEMIEKEGFEDADVLLITDGICNTDDGWDQRFQEAKDRLKFKVYTVLTGHWAQRSTVEKWSDAVFDFSELLTDSFKDKMYSI